MSATPQEVCAEAARLIREHGWVQGRLGSASAGYCLLGALLVGGGSDDLSWPWSSLYDLLGGMDVFSVWNDDPKRTKAEVLAVLDKAAQS